MQLAASKSRAPSMTSLQHCATWWRLHNVTCTVQRRASSSSKQQFFFSSSCSKRERESEISELTKQGDRQSAITSESAHILLSLHTSISFFISPASFSLSLSPPSSFNLLSSLSRYLWRPLLFLIVLRWSNWSSAAQCSGEEMHTISCYLTYNNAVVAVVYSELWDVRRTWWWWWWWVFLHYWSLQNCELSEKGNTVRVVTRCSPLDYILHWWCIVIFIILPQQHRLLREYCPYFLCYYSNGFWR